MKWIVPELTIPFTAVSSEGADPVISILSPYSRAAYAVFEVWVAVWVASSARMPTSAKYDASFRIFKAVFIGGKFKRGCLAV